MPIVNPDGRVISVETPENHRWNVRPNDEDGDGRIDEDPPEDLDKDGRILQMRVKDPAGRWKISPEDPRLMVARAKDETGGTYYTVYSEGIDNDNDGRFNEDTVGGVDLNRNFPANWTATQLASGPYPLSEPESRALVEYMTSRPNIAAVHTFHTSGGMLLRFPTLADQNWDFPESDIKDYQLIGQRGAEITGYTNDWEKKRIVDMMAPGHGVFNDWASLVYGVTAVTTEMWRHPRGSGGSKDLLDWADKTIGKEAFVNWHPYQHPQLGAIELGGFDKWVINSPPERLIEAEVERNARWVLTFSERVPRVVLQSADAVPAGGAAGTFDVKATVANVGWMPTATAHAEQVLESAKPVVARITLINAQLVDEPDRGPDIATGPRGRGLTMARFPGERSLGVLPGAREQGPSARPITWRVRVRDAAKPANAEIVVISEKAGTARRQVNLAATSR